MMLDTRKASEFVHLLATGEWIFMIHYIIKEYKLVQAQRLCKLQHYVAKCAQ